MTKECPKCQETKEFTLFNKNKNTKDGLQHWCRLCTKAAKAKWDVKVKDPNYVKFAPDRNIRNLTYYLDPLTKTKQCAKCKKVKTTDQFSVYKRKLDGLRDKCNECRSEEAAKRYRTPAGIAANKNKRLKSQYGINLDIYDSMYTDQGGVCAICGQPETAKNQNAKVSDLSVDHCHATLVVRGLLCNRHNRAIGLFNDDPIMLRAAADYLERSKKKV
jgi:hypothetical protein